MTTIWTQWLPDPVRKEAEEEEPKRFAALVEDLQRTWDTCRDEDWPENANPMLIRYPLLFQFMESGSVFEIDVVEKLIRLGLEVVLTIQSDVVVNVRYAEALNYFLKKHKTQLKGQLHIEWKPFYDLCLNTLVHNRYLYCGDGTLIEVRHTLFYLVYSCSKYFSKTAIFEIWDTLKPSVTNLQNTECFIALGWLSTFFPTQELAPEYKDKWNALFSEWLELFESVSLCYYWTAHWFDIFARMAKYDTQGLIDWNGYASKLFSVILNSFDLPIGTATGAMKYSKATVPNRAERWFSSDVYTIERSAAKCMIFMLRNDTTQQTVLQYITKMIDLLEQYCHPSNRGNWTTTLASFLKYLVKQLIRVISNQDSSGETKPHLTIPNDVRKVLVAHLLKLASRGQFSSRKEMRGEAADALLQLAYLDPQSVLPLVYSRFMGAIHSPHAPTTVRTSMHAFALCVRPLLMHGLHLPDVDPQEAASEAVAQAMMEVLPGLDANDPAKTGAVFRFYAAVLFSLPTLDFQSMPQSRTLPLDVELWAEEFLSRIFVLLENLEGPEARPDQSHTTETTAYTGTFVSKESVFFEWCMEGFLLKLPRVLQLRAIKRISSFLLSSPLPSSSQECECLCSALVQANAEATYQHLIQPLIQELLEELPPLTGEALNDFMFTHALTTKICWNLRLVGSALNDWGDLTVQNLKDICEVVDRACGVTNREIQDVGGAWMLKMMIEGLFPHCPKYTNASLSEHILPSGISRWVAKYPEMWTRPEWYTPSEQHISTANALVDRYLVQSVAKLNQLMESDEVDDTLEDLCNAHLSKICGVLSGTGECMRPFETTAKMKEEIQKHPNVISYALAGNLNISVGPAGTREALCAMLLKLCNFLSEADPTVLSNLVEVVDMTLNHGNQAPPSTCGVLRVDLDDSTCKTSLYFTEPAIAHPYIQQDGSKCRKRRPCYNLLSRVWTQFGDRVKDAAYQKHHSSVYPAMQTPETVPEMIGELMGPLFKFVTHPYEEVAEMAKHSVEKLWRRFPILTKLYPPFVLPSLTRLPLPEDLSMRALLANPNFEREIFAQMEAFMQPLESDTLVSKDVEMDLGVAAAEDAALRGAARLMNSADQAWSGIFRVPEKTAAMIYAFIGGRRNTSSNTQVFLTYLIWQFLSHFVSPPYIRLNKETDVVHQLRQRLCLVGREGVLANWKFSLIANILLLLVLPKDRSSSVDILEHFLDISVCSLPLLRKIGLLGIEAMLRPTLQSADPTTSPLAAVVKGRLRDATFVKRFVQVMVDDHEVSEDSHSNNTGSNRGHHRMSNSSFEEKLVSGARVFVDRFGSWPEGESIRAISNGAFVTAHAAAIYAMGQMAPSELCEALKVPLTELSSRVGTQQREKHELSALTEIMAGFTASAAPFLSDGVSGSPAWDSWYANLLTEVLGQCPFDVSTGALSVSVRYMAYHLLDEKLPSSYYERFMRVLLAYEEKTGTGQSTGEMKKLCFLHNAFREISPVDPFEAVPQEFLPLYSSVLDLLKKWLVVGFHSVRRQVTLFVVRLCSYISSDTPTLDAPRQQLILQSRALLQEIVQQFNQGLQAIEASKQERELPQSTSMNGEGSENHDVSTIQNQVGIAVQFVRSAMHDPHVTQLTPVLIQLLPGIFQIQELGDARLKPLQTEAVNCFASLKYLTVHEAEVDSVISALTEASAFPQWHARGAAIVFLQVFWYHHSLMLTSAQSATLRFIVVELLVDEKLEVQNAACSTLSGMIKGMSEAEQSSLRGEFLAQVRGYYPNGRRKKASTPSELTQRHASVLGLKAFILAHPYDIPSWMAEVLVTMISAAHDTHPIKTTVTKTLGDFRTTHENESHEALRDAFDEDTWETIQAVGSQASYFS